MKAAFISDHRYPKYKGDYYESPGFDNVVLQRYLNIFGNVKVLARHDELSEEFAALEKKLYNSHLTFFTIPSSKLVFSKRGFTAFENEILDCDYAVIRMPSTLGIVASKICVDNHIPYIIELVACPWDSVKEMGTLYWMPALVLAALTRIVLRKANYAVYVTEHFLEQRYPTKGKYIACSNVALIHYEDFDFSKRISRIKNFVPRRNLIIGTCADLDAKYKSQQDGIEALKILRDYGFNARYQLVGGGNQERFKKIAKNLGIEEYVEFLGQLSHEEVFQWLDNIDIYVHPSRQEGLCRAIIEAMSRGCPVVAADAGGIHELIDDECIFPKGDVRTSVQMVMDLVNSKNKMRVQADRNFKKAEKYRSDILADRRKRFFEKFIKGTSKNSFRHAYGMSHPSMLESKKQ